MSEKMRVLFVDDEPMVLEALRRALHSEEQAWDMTFLTSPEEALTHLAECEVDTIVTDVQMPGMDGLELIRQVRVERRRADIPIIVLTGLGEAALKRRALDLGATDLLSKPVHREDLIARVRSSLRIKSQQDELKAYTEGLEQLVAERTQELADSRLDILWRLGKAAEHRDEDTGQHIVRVSLYCRELAAALGLDRDKGETVFLTSPLHDVGKIGIPDAILLKPGKLSDQERAVIERHCEMGVQILCDESLGMRAYLDLQGREGHAGSQAVPLLQTAAAIALSHHERWDGSGYPRGLKGEAIPLEGRIVALADVYDALSSKRPYKLALPEAETVAILNREAGSHFDPAVHAAFGRLVEPFREIRHAYADDDGESAGNSEERVRR